MFKSLKTVTQVFDKIDKSEAYADLGINKEEFQKGRSAFSTLARFQFMMILGLCVAVAALLAALVNRPSAGQLSDKDSQILRLTKERDEYKYYVLPKLRLIEPRLEEVEEKIDTIENTAEQNSNHFSKILNKAKDAVNK